MPARNTLRRRLAGAGFFSLLGFYLAWAAPSLEIAWVGAILLLTVYLFAFEVVEVDLAAISILVLLGLSELLAPWMGLDQALIDHRRLFDGFSSNAVIAIIAVMIIGAGLERTGLMTQLAGKILKLSGQVEARVIPIVSGAVGLLSSFMQNVGAAALFLPVVNSISLRTGLPLSRLLMPMGFAAILGGTLTMISSSPLILLNDLLLAANQDLGPGERMQPFGLFAVTPIGLALLAAGIAYFMFTGRYLLPGGTDQKAAVSCQRTQDYWQQIYAVDYQLHEVLVGAESPLVGKTLDQAEADHAIRVVAVDTGDGPRIGAQSLDRSLHIQAGSHLGLLVSESHSQLFAKAARVDVLPELVRFAEALAPTHSGIAELSIAPGSRLIGKSARQLRLRRSYGLSLLAIHRAGQTIIREGGGVRDTRLQSGDALVVHTTWKDLARLEQDPDFVVITSDYPHPIERPHKVLPALLSFGLALSLVLFSDLKLSVALLCGALGMLLSGVLRVDEAYRAVSWKTVFLLASLIPLGVVVGTSGTAGWIAERVLLLTQGAPTWLIQGAIALLATAFSLVMSNVGATVLLVPLAINIALGVGADPALFALTVALATSNAFLIPTHQVNALIMGPAGYRVADFLRVGGPMTLLFLIVMLGILQLAY